MTENEIIRAWKENEKPLGLLPEEMQGWLKKTHNHTDFMRYSLSACWVERDCREYYENSVYRLRPDYPETPEVIELEIFDAGDRLCVSASETNALFYPDAPCITKINNQKVRFIGYKYGDSLYLKHDPVVYSDSKGRIMFGFHISEKATVTFPTHAVYERVDQ